MMRSYKLPLYCLIMLIGFLAIFAYILLLMRELKSSSGTLKVSIVATSAPLIPGLADFRRQDGRPDEPVLTDARNSPYEKSVSVVQPIHEIEIWGKASIAEYLWTHILQVNATTYANGLLKHGETTIGDMHFRFRSGPGIIPPTVPHTVRHLVLVLNGNDATKVKFARSWLDYLHHFRDLRHVALILLGSESCDNDWLLPYLKSRGGRLSLVFLIYDSPVIDNREIYQWPLGVATYRGFPHFHSTLIPIAKERIYLCNFLGTVYKNSSREDLLRVITNQSLCYLNTRGTWIPNESYASMERYLKVLTESDLTLSPAGKNPECYRIYEALALGSLPILENIRVSKKCAEPYRLLKRYQAPVQYVDNWQQVLRLLEKEKKMPLGKRVERRKAIVKWYENFKLQLKELFLGKLREAFFKVQN